jgi:hypothetical protein
LESPLVVKSAQLRAVERNRKRMREKGVSRFEVRALDRDKALIREVAKRLAVGDADAQKLRADLSQRVEAAAGERGGIWRALRRSPLVGSGIEFKREVSDGRKIDL